jgi:hypothetical protein
MIIVYENGLFGGDDQYSYSLEVSHALQHVPLRQGIPLKSRVVVDK